MNYLNELNPSQRQAVEQTEGPVMIIAGAGSGKTRVLTFRIAHLIEKGVDAFNILALTFTNKASREMKSRIGKVVGESEAKNLWMGTFHSVFAKILRIEAEKIGYPSNFTIYDTDDSRSLLKSIIKEMDLDDTIYKPSLVHGRISQAKNNLISANAYCVNVTIQADDRQTRKPQIGEIYKKYDQRCFQASAMDFDDLLFKTNVLLRDHPEVLYKYQEKFKYILVDEFQDTNFSQYLLLKQLAARFENICVVGDDAQSIYAFRGANIQNILNFKSDYSDTKIFKLEQNYRSTKTIVNAANSIIEKNKEQLKKSIWTDNDEGSRIHVLSTLTDNEEGAVVSNKILELKNLLRISESGFAILYRTNAQSRSFEEALRKRNIPYRIYGGQSFYQRKEIKDIIAYFRLTVNHNDEEALKRIINYPKRGIGQASLDSAIVAAGQNDTSIWNVITNPMVLQNSVNKGTISKMLEFCTMIDSFATQAKSKNAYEVGETIAKTSTLLNDLYNDKTPEGVARYENIQELLNGLKEFTEVNKTEENPNPSLAQYLSEISLLTDADQESENKNHVSLMTIHAAKGLEFPVVFIVGLEENLFPSQLSLNSRQDLEEERRLFYVALTRAEKQAYLSSAATRYRWGQLISCEPSRFINEIDAKYLNVEAPQVARTTSRDNDGFSSGFSNRSISDFKEFSDNRPTKKPETYQPSVPAPRKNLKKLNSNVLHSPTNSDSIPSVEIGTAIEHELFGTGKITQLEGIFPNQKATVEFDKSGKKQLLLKFAKYKVVS